MKKIGNAVLHEIRNAIPAFIFFLVLLHMLAITKAVASNDFELTALRASAATIGALLVTKSILTVEALPLARWFRHVLLLNILWRTLLFVLVAVAFRVVEQAIESYFHQGRLQGVSDFATQFLSPLFLIEIGWITVGMFGFCLIAEYSRLLSGGLVWKILMHHRIESHERGHAEKRKMR